MQHMPPQIFRRHDATAPASEPVTLAELKAQLRKTDSEEDAYLTFLIGYGRETVEQITKRTIARRTLQGFLDFFPGGSSPWWNGVRDGSLSDFAELPRVMLIPGPPLVSVQSIKTYTDLDVSATMAATDYFVDTSDLDQLGRVALRIGAVWPIALRTRNAVEINYTAGYVDGAVPPSLKMGILMVAASAYANRGDCTEECKCEVTKGLAQDIIRVVV